VNIKKSNKYPNKNTLETWDEALRFVQENGIKYVFNHANSILLVGMLHQMHLHYMLNDAHEKSVILEKLLNDINKIFKK